MGIVSDTYSAKANLSRLLDQVEAGQEVTITRRGKPVAKLVAYEPVRRKRVLGALRGQIDDWVDKRDDPEWQAMLDDLYRKWDAPGG